MEAFNTVLILAIFVGGYYLYKRGQKQIEKENKAEEKYDFMVNLNFPLNPREAQKIHNELEECGLGSEIIPLRLVEVIFDSFSIIENSKNHDTIQSRINVARDDYKKLCLDYPSYAKQIKDDYDKYMESYKTIQYANVAKGYLEKAKKLKTTKSKVKYSDMALFKLQEGLKDANADKEAIQKEIDMVNKYKKEIEQ